MTSHFISCGPVCVGCLESLGRLSIFYLVKYRFFLPLRPIIYARAKSASVAEQFVSDGCFFFLLLSTQAVLVSFCKKQRHLFGWKKRACNIKKDRERERETKKFVGTIRIHTLIYWIDMSAFMSFYG